MQSKAQTPTEYLASLPADRKKAITALRKTVKANLGKGFTEGMQYGMIGYFVPLKVYPPGYHCTASTPLPFATIGSQKNHMAFYSFFLYQDKKELDWFVKAWKATGKKLDMGKSCIRFKKIEDVPLEVIGEAIARQDCKTYIANYEKALGPGRKPPSSKKKVAKKATAKKPAKKKPVAKKTTAKKATAMKAAKKKATPKKIGKKKAVAKKPVRKKPAIKKSGTKKAIPIRGRKKAAAKRKTVPVSRARKAKTMRKR